MQYNKIMNRYILLTIGISVFSYAEISAQEALELEMRAVKIRKELGIHTPTKKEKEVTRIRHELKLDFDTSSKDALLGNDKTDTVASLVATHSNTISEDIRDGISKITKNLDFLESNKKEDSWSVSSLFGLSKHKEKKSSLLNIGVLGDIKDTGNTIFKGMKYSGQTAEFSSGVIYKSSKMYNTMFGMFENSPFNVFEEEKETSMFDVFEGGNRVLDIFN